MGTMTITITVEFGESAGAGVGAQEALTQTRPLPFGFASEAEFAQWLNDNPGVWAGEGDTMGWYTIGDLPGDAEDVALYTARPCQVDNIDALARYFFEGPFAGEYFATKCLDEVDGWGRLFILTTDFTKSRRDDYGFALDGLWTHFQEGSPIRKTDRSGVGTKGTRAVDGVRCDLWFAFK